MGQLNNTRLLQRCNAHTSAGEVGGENPGHWSRIGFQTRGVLTLHWYQTPAETTAPPAPRSVNMSVTVPPSTRTRWTGHGSSGARLISIREESPPA